MGRHVLSALLLICSPAEAAFEHTPRGARAVGLGGATVSVEGDLWASFVNPSCLSATDGTTMAAEYLPGFFGMSELKRGAISLSSTVPIGTLALSMSGFGFRLYREMSVGVAVARALNERAVLGIGVNFYSLTIQGYGSDQTVGLDVGVLVHITRGISYGFALDNLNRPTIGSEKEALPQTMRMGISVRPLPNALVALSGEKDSHYPFGLAIGLEYFLEDVVTLRLGAANEPSNIAAGIGIRTSLLCMDYAYTMHPDLGGTHCVSVSFVLPWP
jgi:hypothetical protein